MSDSDIGDLITKLQYHISLLGQTISHDDYPVEGLIISMDWSRDDLNKAHDIFERWDKLLEEGGAMSSGEFEHEFADQLEVSYQGLKSIILAFYKSGQWTNVCESYVDSFGTTPAMEYHSIMRRDRH